MTRARLLSLIVLALCVSVPGSALASETVKLTGEFQPDELGVSTTILIGFHITTHEGEVPSPLVNVELRLPAGTFSDSNSLGLATCNPEALMDHGLGGCSTNALMGRGSAVVRVPLGGETIFEPAAITMLMGPPGNGHTTVLFYAAGASPVIAKLVFPGTLLGESGLFGARLDTTISPIPTLPGAPDAALVSMRSSIGPKGITYYEHVHGSTVAYAPKGFIVPESCGPGGFPFAANFTFADGSKVQASSAARCPLTSGPHHPARR